jgi:hypothetical protein
MVPVEADASANNANEVVKASSYRIVPDPPAEAAFRGFNIVGYPLN